jgi:hypothetical protein
MVKLAPLPNTLTDVLRASENKSQQKESTLEVQVSKDIEFNHVIILHLTPFIYFAYMMQMI